MSTVHTDTVYSKIWIIHQQLFSFLTIVEVTRCHQMRPTTLLARDIKLLLLAQSSNTEKKRWANLGAGNVQGLGILSVVEMVQGDSPHRASLSFPFHGFLRRLLRHSHCLIRRKRGSRVVISGWGDEQYPLCKAPQSTNLKNTHRLPSCERPKFLGERQQILPRMEVEII